MDIALKTHLEGHQEGSSFVCEGHVFSQPKKTEDGLLAIEIEGYWHYFRQQQDENRFVLIGSSEEYMAS